MRRFREYSAALLLLLFCCYYSGISMFSHVHLVNGSSIVHSHLGGNADHDHSDSQYAVIDILSHFQSECVSSPCGVDAPDAQFIESGFCYDAPALISRAHSLHSLRGPPSRLYC